MAETVSLNAETMDQDTRFWERFASRPRVLAKWFHESREKWKQKCQRLRQEFKRLQVQVADVRKSREHWRQKAEYNERELAEMVAQVKQLQEQLEQSEAQKKTSDSMVTN